MYGPKLPCLHGKNHGSRFLYRRKAAAGVRQVLPVEYSTLCPSCLLSPPPLPCQAASSWPAGCVHSDQLLRWVGSLCSERLHSWLKALPSSLKKKKKKKIFFFLFLGLHLRHMEAPWARGPIRAAAASLHHSHSNARSEPCL